AATKRYSRKWTGTTSFWTTKNHQWLTGTPGNAAVPQSPNDDRFPIDDTWYWEGRASGTYNFPYDIAFSASYRAQSGFPGQRTQVFTAPSTVLRQGTVTLRMGQFGEFKSPAAQIVALKVGKRFPAGAGRNVELNFQLFNATNSSGITSVNYQTGTQFGHVPGIASARVARIGAALIF